MLGMKGILSTLFSQDILLFQWVRVTSSHFAGCQSSFRDFPLFLLVMVLKEHPPQLLSNALALLTLFFTFCQSCNKIRTKPPHLLGFEMFMNEIISMLRRSSYGDHITVTLALYPTYQLFTQQWTSKTSFPSSPHDAPLTTTPPPLLLLLVPR